MGVSDRLCGDRDEDEDENEDDHDLEYLPVEATESSLSLFELKHSESVVAEPFLKLSFPVSNQRDRTDYQCLFNHRWILEYRILSQQSPEQCNGC